MKVIFLDFDGVLNSAASFYLEKRIRKANPDKLYTSHMETLCHVCTSNFQAILDHFPEVKVVISSTWRTHYDLEWLKDKLSFYNIDSSKVIGTTPNTHSYYRGEEINEWLQAHPEVTKFIVLDDNEIGDGISEDNIVKTSWSVGLTLEHVQEAIKKLGGRKPRSELLLE